MGRDGYPIHETPGAFASLDPAATERTWPWRSKRAGGDGWRLIDLRPRYPAQNIWVRRGDLRGELAITVLHKKQVCLVKLHYRVI